MATPREAGGAPNSNYGQNFARFFVDDGGWVPFPNPANQAQRNENARVRAQRAGVTIGPGQIREDGTLVDPNRRSFFEEEILRRPEIMVPAVIGGGLAAGAIAGGGGAASAAGTGAAGTGAGAGGAATGSGIGLGTGSTAGGLTGATGAGIGLGTGSTAGGLTGATGAGIGLGSGSTVGTAGAAGAGIGSSALGNGVTEQIEKTKDKPKPKGWKEFLSDEENLGSLGAVIAGLVANRDSGATEEQRRIQRMTEAQMRRADPLHQVAVQLAFGRTPVNYRQGIALNNVPLPE